MIAIRRVSKQFGEVRALVQVTFDVPRGGASALLGPSGSGKTTLLRLVCGLEEPDGGEILLDGQVAGRPGYVLPAWERGIGAVFQKPALWPHLTVRQNIAYGLAGWRRGEAEDRVSELLETVRLEGFSRRFPHELSGGEAQRVALARALAPRPKILLLDEPFSNLDPDLRAAMLSLVQQVQAAAGLTLILVAHDPESASICEQRVTIDAGQVVKIETGKKVVSG